jgi:chromosome partitioning protein
MPRIIGFVSQKGGVGKTTAALNLAAEFSRRGLATLLMDADPSGAAQSIAEDGNMPFHVRTHLLEELTGKTVAAWAKAVREAKADVIILDAPGALGPAFGATIAVSDLVIVPSGATTLDLRGAADTLKIIRTHRKASGDGKPDILVMPSRIDRRTSAGKEAVTTLAGLTEPVAGGISYRAIVADSLAAGEPVPPGTDSAAEFANLADAVMTRLGAEP